MGYGPAGMVVLGCMPPTTLCCHCSLNVFQVYEAFYRWRLAGCIRAVPRATWHVSGTAGKVRRGGEDMTAHITAAPAL